MYVNSESRRATHSGQVSKQLREDDTGRSDPNMYSISILTIISV